ncbi:MAG TPA: hypothetical protein VKH81_24795 [Candidatus Angelobacter sp.]|nr:hypothetical protein [Candidatus Angelobacter sp.]
MKPIYAVLPLALCMVLGCQVSPRRSTSSSGGGSTGGQLYVATPNGILHFSNAETSNGNVAPVGTITAPQISAPQHLFLDTTADRLYVASQGGSSVVIFDNASTLTGATTPTRVISGNATALAAPIDVAVDTVQNLVYVADGTFIRVFASASTVNGNTPPVRNINMGISIGGILLDAPNNQLYVSDPGDNVIDRLDGASSQDVVGIVGGAIAGVDTLLSQPRGLALDAANRIIVGNSANPTSITIYPSAGTATGDVVAVANITGSNTHLQAPGQLALNRGAANGELYVVEPLGASILVFTNINTATGNLAPARSFNGSNTGLTANAITGVAIDPTR